MFKFSIQEQTPRIIFNIFQEFEEQFVYVLHWALEDTSEFNIEIMGGNKEYYTTNSISWEKMFGKITNKRILEKYFQELIDAIIGHLDEQLKKFNNYECATFFNANNSYYTKFIPDNRFESINIHFFQGLAGCDYEVILNEAQTELKIFSINLYKEFYYKFYKRFKKLEAIFEKFNVGSKNSNNTESDKTENNREALQKFYFFELKLIESLSFDKQEQLIELLFSKKTPYQIALLDHLGFFDYCVKRGMNKADIYKTLGKLLDCNHRSIKGNHLVLNPKSEENKTRYTSHLEINKVKKDLEIIFQN